MTGERYVVKTGDSLWNVAQARLGDGHQWKRLWRYNNRADVVKITGHGIPDPNLIYPGQTLLLPVLPAHVVRRPTPTPDAPVAVPRPADQPGRTSTSHAVRALRGTPGLPPVTTIESPISIKFRLDDLRLPPIVQPGAILEMKLAGDVILTSKRTYPAVYVTQKRDIEAQAVKAANHAFGQLLTDTQLSYNAPSNTMTYRSMLVSQSHLPGAAATAIGVQVDSNSPIPKLRFEFVLPKIEGTIASFAFVGVNVKVVVELTPKSEQQRPLDQPGRVVERVRAPQPALRWDPVIGGGLVGLAAAIVVGSLVEDFFTAGAGIADDPASFALAAASIARGLQLIRGAVVPAAAVPALVNVSVRLETSTRPQGAIQPAR